MSFPITGTFIDEITYDIPASNWSDKEWADELDNMKAVSIDTLIFIRGGMGRKTVFPSKVLKTEGTPDFAGMIMAEAEKRDMRVLMGLYISDIDWHHGNHIGEIEINRPFAREIYERYKDYRSFGGWYIPHETNRNVLNISPLMHELSSACKELDPDKKVMISPFFASKALDRKNFITPMETYEEWRTILSPSKDSIDICAFQDGTAPIEEMDGYYGAIKALCREYNIEHWVNTETFERDVRRLYPPIPFNDLREKLSHHAAYADKIITFEFSHFLSPQSIYLSARNLNKRYIEYYSKNK